MPREPHKLLGLIPASVQSAVVMGFEYQLFDFGFLTLEIVGDTIRDTTYNEFENRLCVARLLC